jgi:Na+-transporting methylmalonyl-CoA/oxaloacetate decarboxylase gamma subunit
MVGIDWGWAGLIAGAGFGTVFLVLAILAIVVIIYGSVLKLIEKMGEKKAEEGKEA